MNKTQNKIICGGIKPQFYENCTQLQYKFLAPTTHHTNAAYPHKINHHQLAIFFKNYVFQSSHNFLLLKILQLSSISSNQNLKLACGSTCQFFNQIIIRCMFTLQTCPFFPQLIRMSNKFFHVLLKLLFLLSNNFEYAICT